MSWSWESTGGNLQGRRSMGSSFSTLRSATLNYHWPLFNLVGHSSLYMRAEKTLVELEAYVGNVTRSCQELRRRKDYCKCSRAKGGPFLETGTCIYHTESEIQAQYIVLHALERRDQDRKLIHDVFSSTAYLERGTGHRATKTLMHRRANFVFRVCWFVRIGVPVVNDVAGSLGSRLHDLLIDPFPDCWHPFSLTQIFGTRCQDKDLQDMLGMRHSLHRRRVCLGIQKIKDKEEDEVRTEAGQYFRALGLQFAVLVHHSVRSDLFRWERVTYFLTDELKDHGR